jgi:DNA-binding transcriptional ArsR family regulator
MRMREDTKRCTFSPDSQYADLAAEVFSLLSDATRVRIILALREGEQPVGELAARVGKSPTVVSQHLAKLRWGKIVKARQEGTRVYYSLVDDHARQLVTHAVFQAEHVVQGIPSHHLGPDGLPVGAEEAGEGAGS